MKRLFGTDGIRGKAGEFPLDAATTRRVGASLTFHLTKRLGRRPIIVIGRDTRESGPWVEQEITQGALTVGAECRSAGVITTPGVAFLTRSLSADAGVVISASHNPYYDNGIKIFAASGQKLDEATEHLIESDIFNELEQRDNRLSEAAHSNRRFNESDLKAKYLDYLFATGQGLSLSTLRLVIDCANGAASYFAPKLFTALGAKLITMNDSPDGQNINKNCGSLHMEALQKRVQETNADLGVAFDGDADRALFVNRDGTLVDGDATLWILGNYLKERGELDQNMVVTTVMSNIGLEIAFRSKGVRLVRTDVGDKYVLDQLLATGSSLGGEQSGHIIFTHSSLAGDGMITTLLLLRAIVETDRKLKELLLGFERYPQILVNVRVRQKTPFIELGLQDLIREVELKLGDRGRLLLRYSGTEPLARVMIEGERQSEIEYYASALAKAIEEQIGA